MKRILVAASADISAFNAIPVHLAGVCGALAAQGYAVDLIAPRPREGRPPALDFEAAGIRLRLVPSLSRFGLPNAANLLVVFPVLLAAALAKRARVFYVRFTVGSFLVVGALRLAGATVVSEHNGWMADEVRQLGGGPAVIAFARWCQVRDAALASAVRVVSESLRDRLIAAGADGGKVFVAGNGTDVRRFRPLPRVQALAEAGLPADGVFTIGLIANLTRWQGGHIAVASMTRLPEYRLMVVGGGPELESLKALARKLDVAGRVLFLGPVPVERANAAMNCFDVALAPFPADRPATSPLKLRDYAAAGRPVLASDLPQNRADADRSWARFFRADDADDLARQVRALQAAPETLAAMSVAARRWAEDHLSWDATARAIIARLEDSPRP